MPVRPDQLEDRRPPPASSDDEPAQRLEAHHLELDLEPGQPVAQHRVVDRAVLLGEVDDAVELAGEADDLGEHRDAALEAEQRHRDLPALAGLADHQVGGGAGAGEEDLVELGAAGQLLDRPDLDAVLVERHQQERQPAVALASRARCGQSTKTHWLKCALDVHTFWPSITHSSARRGAPWSARWPGRSRRPARSSPAPTAPRPRRSSAGTAASARRCRRPSGSGRAAPRRGG